MGPPPVFACPAGQIHELSHLWLVHAVNLAKIAHVTQADTARACLDPADLGGRAHELIRDLADRELLTLTKPPQAQAQFALAERGFPFLHLLCLPDGGCPELHDGADPT
jgi:hypothetical protein